MVEKETLDIRNEIVRRKDPLRHLLVVFCYPAAQVSLEQKTQLTPRMPLAQEKVPPFKVYLREQRSYLGDGRSRNAEMVGKKFGEGDGNVT